MGGDTQNWLRFYNCRKEVQYKEDFLNSYYFAMVLANLQKDPLQIPVSVFLEELLEDEKYIFDNTTISKIIKDYVIRLMQKTDTQKKITERNYESELKSFFDQPKNLGSSSVNPLQKDSSFHSLTTKAKLWIFVQLLRNTGPFDDPTVIAVDNHDNVYTLVDGGRLYVGYAKELANTMRDDNERRVSHRSPFEKDLAKYEAGKLLAETEKGWKQIIAVYESYDEDEVASKLKDNIERAKEMMVLTIEQKEEIREKFIERTRPMKKMSSQENNNEAPPPYYQPNIRRCIDWPNCRFKKACQNLHPETNCRNFPFPPCPGIRCQYIHPDCENDGNCTLLDCAYEHRKSVATLRRIWIAQQNGASPDGRNQRDDQNRPMNNNFKKITTRCSYWPECIKSDDECHYIHPIEECTFFSARSMHAWRVLHETTR